MNITVKSRITCAAIFIACALFFSLQSNAETIIVTGNKVFLRTSPSANADYYATETGQPIYAYKGEQLEWTGSVREGFYEVLIGEQTYYVSGKYIKLKGNKTAEKTTGRATYSKVLVTGTHVRIRLSPSLKGKILTDGSGKSLYPQKGEKLTCTGESGDFWKVDFAGQKAYISKKFAKPVR